MDYTGLYTALGRMIKVVPNVELGVEGEIATERKIQYIQADSGISSPQVCRLGPANNIICDKMP